MATSTPTTTNTAYTTANPQPKQQKMENTIDTISAYSIQDINDISIPDVTQLEDIEIVCIQGIQVHIGMQFLLRTPLPDAQSIDPRTIDPNSTYNANLNALKDKIDEFIQSVRDNTTFFTRYDDDRITTARCVACNKVVFPNNVNDIFDVSYIDTENVINHLEDSQ